MGGFFLSYKKDNTRVKELKDDNKDLSAAFCPSRIANFSDDIIGVLGWKGAGLLLIALILVVGIFKVLFN